MHLTTDLPTAERLSLRKEIVILRLRLTAGHSNMVSPLLAIYEPRRATLLFQDLGQCALCELILALCRCRRRCRRRYCCWMKRNLVFSTLKGAALDGKV